MKKRFPFDRTSLLLLAIGVTAAIVISLALLWTEKPAPEVPLDAPLERIGGIQSPEVPTSQLGEEVTDVSSQP